MKKNRLSLLNFSLYFAFMYNLVENCSVTNSFKFPTLEEQTFLASAIIRGKVLKTEGNINQGSIQLKVREYIKGCGKHRKIIVNGFTNSARCGVGTPKVGSEIVVFLCPESSNKKVWRLNDYTLFTGLYVIKSKDVPKTQKTRKTLKKLRKQVLKESGCIHCCQSMLPFCLKRDGSPNFKKDISGLPNIDLPRASEIPSFLLDKDSFFNDVVYKKEVPINKESNNNLVKPLKNE